MTEKELLHRDHEIIKDVDETVACVMNAIEDAKRFNHGDYLVLYRQNPYNDGAEPKLETNSYGAVRKFKIIYVDDHGIPYCKEINSRGHAQGQILPCVHLGGINSFLENNEFFSVDPSYAEAIILGEQNDYNPTQRNKNLSDLFKEIVAFNRSIKVNTHEKIQLIKFLDSLQVGDSFWASPNTQHVVQEISPIPKDGAKRIYVEKSFIKTINTKGKTINWSWGSIYGKNIYIARPRSNQELKI